MNYSKPEIVVVGDGADLIQGIPTPHKEPNMVDPGPYAAD